MSNRAWVTLATNDSYGLGALVLAYSLRRVGSTHSTVVLITPSVTDAMRDRLRAVFTEVVTVDVLDSRDAAHLALLQRPELGITFTKIHCWGLTQYEKCVFLDADTLVVQNCDELFEREVLSAAPDVGWPDCFNSGVFVYKPSTETFDALIKFAQERGSFDGGDQGLLNAFFSDWARGDINKHLPFLYNVTSAAFYSYLPALKHYGQDLKIIHFIGAAKPWLQPYNWESRSVDAPDHIKGLLQLWWDLFVGQVHQQLDSSMVEDVEVATPALPPPDVGHYEPSLDPQSEFRWHHPDAQLHEGAAADTVNITEYYDPWQNYRGNIPPNPNLEATDDRQAVRDYAWEYKAPAQNLDVWQPPSGYQHDTHWHNEPHHHHTHSYDYRDPQSVHSHTHIHGHQTDQHHGWYQEHEAGPFFTSHDNFSQHHHSDHEHGQHGHHHTQYPHDHHYDHTSQPYNNSEQSQRHESSNDVQGHKDIGHTQDHHPYHDHSNSEQSQRHESPNDAQGYKDIGLTRDYHHYHDHNNFEQSQRHESPNVSQGHKQFVHTQVDYVTNNSRLHIVHHVHIDYGNREADVPVATEDMNGVASETESCDHEDIKPRHPYDNYYLKHRAAIDPYGRKICSHEIPPTPSPSPPPESMSPVHPEEEIEKPAVEIQSGVAGNLARVVPGAAAREAVDELTRRQGWEAGNIDYMGADSFDNIWAKISQTLNQPRTSPPKQPSPPKEAPRQPSPPKEPAPKQPSPPKEAPAAAEPAEAPVEAKPAETLAEAKPVEAPVETKPTEASVEAKPAETAAEVKPAEVPGEAGPAETPVEAKPPQTPAEAEPAEVSAETKATEAPAAEAPAAEVPAAEKPADVPVAEAAGKQAPVSPAVEAPAPAKAPAPVPAEAPAPAPEAPAVAAAAPLAAAAPAAEAPKEEMKEKTEKQVPPTPPATPKSTPEPMPGAAAPAVVEALLQAAAPATPTTLATPVTPATPITPEAAPAPVTPATPTTPPAPVTPATPTTPQAPVTPEKALDATTASTDSPPLANTPSKEEPPKEPAAKSEECERRKPAEKLQLSPPAVADPLPTPDSELEDAAALAHAIIASELAPAPAVSLAQIGVKPKGKSTAAQIESSVALPTGPATPPAEAPEPKPGTPVKPSAKVPASPSAEAPPTPSAAAPPTPSAAAPPTPSAEAPPTPSAEAPSTPSAEALPTPSAEAPATPSTEAPASPSAEAPATPSAETPATPSAEAPASPTTEAAPKDAPKKKVVKKVVKKEGDAPVPPPRKKEKKPKDK